MSRPLPSPLRVRAARRRRSGARLHPEDPDRVAGQPGLAQRKGSPARVLRDLVPALRRRSAPSPRPLRVVAPFAIRLRRRERRRRGCGERLRLPRLLRPSVPRAARPGRQAGHLPVARLARAGLEALPGQGLPDLLRARPARPDRLALRRRAAGRPACEQELGQPSAGACRHSVSDVPVAQGALAIDGGTCSSHERQRAAETADNPVVGPVPLSLWPVTDQEDSRRASGSSALPTRPCARRTCAGSPGCSGRTRASCRVVCGLIVVSAALGVVSPFLLRGVLDTAILIRRPASSTSGCWRRSSSG